MGRFLPLLLMVAALAAAAGCAASRPQPVLAAATPCRSKVFGYSDTKLARIVTRWLRHPGGQSLPTDAKARADVVEKEKQRAYDLALWHAAQLALAAAISQLTSAAVSIAMRSCRRPRSIAPRAGRLGPGGMIYPQWIYNTGSLITVPPASVPTGCMTIPSPSRAEHQGRAHGSGCGCRRPSSENPRQAPSTPPRRPTGSRLPFMPVPSTDGAGPGADPRSECASR